MSRSARRLTLALLALAILVVVAAPPASAAAPRVAPPSVEPLMSRLVLDEAPPSTDPVRPACEQACKQRAERQLKVCLAGGTAPERCQQQATAFARQCIADNCPRVAPVPSTPPCRQACASVARAFLERCKRASTAPSPEACERQAKELLARCIATRCKPKTVEPAPVPPVEPAPCKQRCEAAARAQYDACVAGGGAPERCKNQAKSFLEKCLPGCPRR